MSEAYCYCDYEAPIFASTTHPVAKRQHKCDECGRIIHQGEKYERVAGMWEPGSLDTFKLCSHCCDIRDWARISFPYYDKCWAYSNILDDVKEYVKEESWKVPGLFFEYGRRIIRARQYRQTHP